jgi:hypothetical protein
MSEAPASNQPPAAYHPPQPQYVKHPDAQIRNKGHMYVTDVTSWAATSVGAVFQALTYGVVRSNKASALGATAPSSLHDEYDEKTQSWAGEEGLRYRVPLTTIPGAAHCRRKNHNIQILLYNVRELCVNNQLPATKEEKQFWAQYRFLRYQLFWAPFMCSLSVTYVAARAAFSHLPAYIKGRSFPVMLSLVFAEQMQEVMFPGEELLRTAMQARTPLGDAARAEWLRLQPVTIPQGAWIKYRFSLWFMDPLDGFEFGGNIAEACK